VGSWLEKIGLEDYREKFKENHISGKNLLHLTEKELKKDLEMTSVGHRKNFSKGVENLKKIYEKNKVYKGNLRKKLMKFYEKHKNKLFNNSSNGQSHHHHHHHKGGRLSGIRSSKKFNSYLYSGNYGPIEEDLDESYRSQNMVWQSFVASIKKNKYFI
jgi:hypothetical protein